MLEITVILLPRFRSIRNRVKAQKENFAASKEEYNAVMVSLCAQVASAYINLRELQQEVDVVTQNCLSQQAVVEITQKRYETGLVSKLDVAQAQSVYYSTKASLPMLEAGIIQYTNALAVLIYWCCRCFVAGSIPPIVPASVNNCPVVCAGWLSP